MKKPILLVDDDKDDVFFLQQAIKKLGVPTPLHVATDGRMAIDYLTGAGKFADREAFPLPCLVLLDLKLPFVMGLDVLKWVRHRPGLSIPVIILTSSKNSADIQEAYRLGANAYLVKPTGLEKLAGMIKSIQDFWLTQNTPPP